MRDRGALIVGLITAVAGIILLFTGPWILGLVVLVVGAVVTGIAVRGG